MGEGKAVGSWISSLEFQGKVMESEMWVARWTLIEWVIQVLPRAEAKGQ